MPFRGAEGGTGQDSRSEFERRKPEAREPSSVPVEPAAPRVVVSSAQLRCPYCHETFSTGKALSVCSDCLARHHAACWREHGKCSACASKEELIPRTATAPTKPPPGARPWMIGAIVVLTIALVASAVRSQVLIEHAQSVDEQNEQLQKRHASDDALATESASENAALRAKLARLQEAATRVGLLKAELAGLRDAMDTRNAQLEDSMKKGSDAIAVRNRLANELIAENERVVAAEIMIPQTPEEQAKFRAQTLVHAHASRLHASKLLCGADWAGKPWVEALLAILDARRDYAVSGRGELAVVADTAARRLIAGEMGVYVASQLDAIDDK